VKKLQDITESRQKVKEFFTNNFNRKQKVALVGIGNQDRHDDYVGVFIIQTLQQMGLQKENLLLVEAGDAPSNFISEIHDWLPDCVIMVDAVDAKTPPGTLLIIQKEQLHSHSVDSHSNAKILLLDFLLGLIPHLQIVILGIQVQDITFGQELSKEVRASAEWLAECLFKVLH
jgi:hydrogenase maturation protease